MALDSVRFTIQNAGWSTLNPAKASSTRKAMRAYRKSHPTCELTGWHKKIQIHHIVPVWANPEIADHPDNFIALSSQAHVHLIYGHNGNFRRYYVKDVKEIAKKMRAIKKDMYIIDRNDREKVMKKKTKVKITYGSRKDRFLQRIEDIKYFSGLWLEKLIRKCK